MQPRYPIRSRSRPIRIGYYRQVRIYGGAQVTEVIYDDSGTITVDIQASGVELAEVVDSNTILVDIQPSGVEIREIPDASTVLVDIQPSGTEFLARELTDSATVPIDISTSGVENKETLETGTVLVDIQPSGTELREVTETGTVFVDIQPSGTDELTAGATDYIDSATVSIDIQVVIVVPVTGLTSGFETGSNGANIATSDAGDATAWNVRSVTSGTITYDNTHVHSGSLAGKFAFSFASAQTYVQWTSALFTPLTEHYGRVYLYATAYPSADADNFPVGFRNGTGADCSIRIKPTTGEVRVEDAAFVASDGTVPIALNQWVRIEWRLVHHASTGIIEAKLFNNPESTTPSDTITFSNRNTGVVPTAFQFGSDNAGNSWTFWLDDILVNATSYPGPFVVPTDIAQFVDAATVLIDIQASGTDLIVPTVASYYVIQPPYIV